MAREGGRPPDMGGASWDQRVEEEGLNGLGGMRAEEVMRENVC